MKIESTDQDIRTLLSSGYYRIPRFQRPYSWDRDNVQEFWDDVIKAMGTDYFIGSMVVFKDGHQRFGVVDGQQRLTTITILLCALRNSFRQMGEEDLAQGVHSLVERKNIDNKSEFIVTTESSYPYFQDRIQREGAASLAVQPLKEEEALQAAFEQLTQLVGGEIAKVKVGAVRERLVEMRDAVLNLKLISIKLEDEDDAYLIFETLNTRGKDLGLKDLVKNHITKHMKSATAAPDTAKIKWEELLELLESSSADLDVDTFIHHYWLSKFEYLPAKTLFKSLKKSVLPGDVPGFMNDLLDDAKLYRAIHERGYRKWSKEERRIADALAALTIFRVEQQSPCVLSLLREKRTGKLKRRSVEEALVAIEKFHFLFTAITSQRSSGGISAMYAALGRRLFEAKDAPTAGKVVVELKEKLRARVPSKAEFIALFPNVIYTDRVSKQKRLVKYMLSEMDPHRGGGTVLDYDAMTIEHLAPQSLVGTGGMTDAIVGQLGNLILVSGDLNARLKALPFTEKKKVLKGSGMKLPPEIAQAKAWGKREIAARTGHMAEDAYTKIWSI